MVFKINGEVNDCSGAMSVGSAGDINGDGYTDVVIGALNNSNTGRVYVIFGKPGIGNSGLITLSSLNGTNGFKLDGDSLVIGVVVVNAWNRRHQWRWLWRFSHWSIWL